MINLLPPTVKKQVYFSKLNRTVIGYIWLVGIVGLLIAASFSVTWLYFKNKINATQAQITEKESQRAHFGDIENKAKGLADRLAAIDKIQTDQNKFSNLLTEMANLTPKGVYIYTIAVGNDIKQPVSVLAYADSSTSAVSLQKSLATSPRFSDVTIKDVTQGNDPYSGAPDYRINLIVSLKSGATK